MLIYRKWNIYQGLIKTDYNTKIIIAWTAQVMHIKSMEFAMTLAANILTLFHVRIMFI